TTQADAGEDYSPVLDYTLGSLALQAGDIERAVAQYRTAIERFPNFYRAYQNLGLAYIQDRRFGEALPFLLKALELGGGNGGLYGLIGYSYLSTDRPEAGLDAYRQALLYQPESRDWRLGKLNSLIASGAAAEAARYLDELIKEMPGNADLWMQQANSFLQLQRYEDAIANLEYLRRENLASPPSLALLGDLYLSESLPGLALTAYQAARESGELSTDRELRMVESLVARNALAEADALIGEIKSSVFDELAPGTQTRLLTLEARTALGLEQPDRAFALLQEVVERDPLNGEAQLTLGDFYRERGDLVRAEFAYEAAEKVEAYRLRALTALARLEVAQREYQAALRYLRRAQEIEERDFIARYIRQLEAAVSSAS
ncbi:MAG: tetratricopeptide repeat protein, partial [Verrucomicrobiota bacterium]